MTTITISDATESYIITADTINALHTSHLILGCFTKRGEIVKARGPVISQISSYWSRLTYLDIGAIGILSSGFIYRLLK